MKIGHQVALLTNGLDRTRATTFSCISTIIRATPIGAAVAAGQGRCGMAAIVTERPPAAEFGPAKPYWAALDRGKALSGLIAL